MKDKVKKAINFRLDRYQDTELKMQKLAAKGWLLKECVGSSWEFRKGEPKDIKYAITFIPEESGLDPEITDHRQTYVEIAKAAGWHFVTQSQQLQVFCSEIDNPRPLATDEKKKFDYIRTWMKESISLFGIVMILLVVLGLIIFFHPLEYNPIHFWSSGIELSYISIALSFIIHNVYSLLHYFMWCKRSKHSIKRGGECVGNAGVVCRIVHIIVMCFIFIGIAFLLHYLILKFAFQPGTDSNYRTITRQHTETESREYRLYSDIIPLTCEDLYGRVDYEYYSYEKEIDSTCFLTKSSYRQEPLPEKEAPLKIEYDILETRFDFIYNIAKKQLFESIWWRDAVTFKTMDNEMFGTVEAYQAYFDGSPTGAYILLLKEKIIMIHLEKPATAKQMLIIREKLQI